MYLLALILENPLSLGIIGLDEFVLRSVALSKVGHRNILAQRRTRCLARILMAVVPTDGMIIPVAEGRTSSIRNVDGAQISGSAHIEGHRSMDDVCGHTRA